MKDHALTKYAKRLSTSRRVLTVGFIALTAACAAEEALVPAGPTIVEAGRQHLEILVEAAGELEPLRAVEVMSKASGEVIETLVETGDPVDTGTLVARIDPRDVQNDFNQTEADYEVALERLAIAESQLRRSEQLLAAGVITTQEHEGRDLEFANARANLVRAETSLDLARLRLADVTIRSPLTGTVLAMNVEEGQVISSPSGNVSGGTVLMTIADLSVMQVRTLVAEADVGRIEAGMPATVFVDAFQDRSFEGVVEKIEPQAVVEQNVVNFPVIVSLDNREGILKPGMSADVTVLLAERPNAITLPNNAIVSFEEMAAAASVLGVPEDRLNLDPSAFQELRREAAMAAAPTGEGPAGADAGPAGSGAAMSDSAGAAGGPLGGGMPTTPEERQALRERIQSGDIPPEIRAQLQAARGAGRGGFIVMDGPDGGAPGAAGEEGRPVRSNASAAASGGRPGIVFVEGPDGTLSPRPILVGVTDWSNSEILAGLDEGERVALIAVAAMIEETGQGMGGFRGVRIPF
jgi:HlyD family secretion protein